MTSERPGIPKDGARWKARVLARGFPGYLFSSTEGGAFCFVPEHCLGFSTEGEVQFNDAAYVAGGWGGRNMGLAGIENFGRFLFPDFTRPVTELETPEVREFLRRLG